MFFHRFAYLRLCSPWPYYYYSLLWQELCGPCAPKVTHTGTHLPTTTAALRSSCTTLQGQDGTAQDAMESMALPVSVVVGHVPASNRHVGQTIETEETKKMFRWCFLADSFFCLERKKNPEHSEAKSWCSRKRGQRNRTRTSLPDDMRIHRVKEKKTLKTSGGRLDCFVKWSRLDVVDTNSCLCVFCPPRRRQLIRVNFQRNLRSTALLSLWLGNIKCVCLFVTDGRKAVCQEI